MQQTVTVVNLVSLSYSGSTWLNLMLGSHSQAFSVGEMKRVLYENKSTCSIHGESCAVWQKFSLHNGENPFLQLARITGKRVLIVNNSRKFMPDQQHPQIQPLFLHLVRDMRAVVASALRKRPDESTWAIVRQVAHDRRRNRRLIRRQSREHLSTIHYERAQANTEAEMQRLCEFIGLPYEPGMLEFWNTDHCFIGGNRGTLFSMLRQNDPQASAKKVLETAGENPLNWDMSYYKKADPGSFVDDRWKKELSDRQLRLFALWAGRLNRRYGYPPALDRGPVDLGQLRF